MADNNLDPDLINQLNQQLRDLTDVINSQSVSMKQGAHAAGVFTSSLKSSSHKVTSGSEVLKKAGTDFNEQMRQYGQTYDRTTKEWVSAKDKEINLLTSSQKAVYEELQAKRANILKEVQRNKLFTDQLKSLGYSQDANGKLTKTAIELNDAQRKQVIELRKHEQKIQEMQRRYDEFGDTMKKNSENLVKGLGNFAAGLARGDSSFASLNPIIDLVADSLGSVAKLIPLFGDGIAAGIKVGADAAKLTMELLDKNLKMFQDISNMGGLVSNGMQGLQNQVVNAGMSMEGFTKIVRENGTEFAAFGGTVGLGADKFMGAIGKLTKKGGDLEKAGIDLRKLGLTADNIGEQAAAFLQQEIRLGRSKQEIEKNLTTGTIKYVKELDLLQKVTGMSREEIQKQRDSLMSDTRYRMAYEKTRQESGEAAAEGMNKFIMTIKDPELKRGFMDLASGVATSDEARKAITTFGDTVPEVLRKLKQIKKPEDTAKAFDESNALMMQGAKRAVSQFGDVMMYGTDQLISGATAQDLASGKNMSSMEAAEKLQKTQLEAVEKLTDSTVEAQAEMDTMKNKMFEFSNTLMKHAAPAVAAFTTALNKGVEFINKTFGKNGEQNTPAAGTLRQQRQKAHQELEKQTEARKQVEAQQGRGSEDAKKARIAEMQARDEARKKALEESSGRSPASRSITGAPVTPPATEQKTDVSKLLRFQGDSLGNKQKYDALEPAVRENFEKMLAEYGKPVQINAAMRTIEDQKKLYDAAKLGPNGKKYNAQGNPVAPPGRSNHNYGKALDLNSQQVAEMKSLGLLDKYGFSTINGDPPHIEMAKFGGMFDGPQSGYPVMLHGKETVLPKQQMDTIQSILEKVTKESLPSLGTSSPLSLTQDESINLLKDLYVVMSEKLNEVVDKLSSGNDTREELLQYSRA